MTNTLILCKLSLDNVLPNVFWAGSSIPVADVLGNVVVYTDSSVKGLGSIGACSGAAAYFSDINNGIGVEMSVAWNKVKGHFGINGNEYTNLLANAATGFDIMLPVGMSCHFLSIEGKSVFENAHYFVKCFFNAISFVNWKAKCVTYAVESTLWNEIDMQSIHNCLSVAKRKRLYDSDYLSILCIWCELVKDSNHTFSYIYDAGAKNHLYMSLAKDFVLKDWIDDMVCLLGGGSNDKSLVISLVQSFAKSHRSTIWLPTAKLRVLYEKRGFLPHDGSIILVVFGLASLWSLNIIFNFGIKLGIHVCYGLHFHLSNAYFSFLGDFSVIGGLGV
ncbi:hypothetical protein G9A89_019730 [Geosiphon pyriformis]|nr:hypothetical protein G9A89_019730 [Geosiphon pyriformis]